METLTDTNAMVVELVPRKPTGWQTRDGRYVVTEWRRGEWHARDSGCPDGMGQGVLVAVAGTRVGVAKRLGRVISGSYNGVLPCRES